jgi:hypothetical protein
MKMIELDTKNLDIYIGAPKELVDLVKSKKKKDQKIVSAMNPFIVSAIKAGKKIPLNSDRLKVTMLVKD